MISRKNWKAVRKYIEYRTAVDQLQERSIEQDWIRLRHLLIWADEKDFSLAPTIRPTFPEYIKSRKKEKNGEALSPEYAKKIVRTAKNFFLWLRMNCSGYSALKDSWLATLKLQRMNDKTRNYKAVDIEQIKLLAQVRTTDLWEKRIQAAIIFMFLTGIRVGAFVSLNLESVDLEKRLVYQWSELGVKTEFGKRITTVVLDVPDLLEIVREWDRKVRLAIPNNGYWFAQISPMYGTLDSNYVKISKYRSSRVYKDLERWLELHGLPKFTPHQLRHGNAVYSLKMCKDVADLKAVSQNLGHSSLAVTDGVYGILPKEDVFERISSLGKGTEDHLKNKTDIAEQLENIAAELRAQR